MLRFLLTPKWLLGHVLVATMLVLFIAAGFWQLSRLAEVRADGAEFSAQTAREQIALPDALAAGLEPYTAVRAHGRYLADAQVLSTPQSQAGRPGHYVLTPLETEVGILLVERGWVPFDRDGVDERLTAPPAGTVEVAGMLMPPQAGPAGDGAFVGGRDPAAVAERTGLPLLELHVQLDEPDAAGLLASPPPEFDEGNHLSYAVQWFLFTVVVAVGYPVLIWRTAKERRDGEGAGSAEPASADASGPAGTTA